MWHDLHPRPEQLERLRHRAVFHVGRVRVPADADGRMAAVLHDRLHVRRHAASRCRGPRPRFRRPASAAALPHGISDLPICSSVFSTGTPWGSPFGRTLTPRPPRSATSCDELLARLDVLLRPSPGRRTWNSQIVPQPQIVDAGVRRTSCGPPCAAPATGVGSTPCLCVRAELDGADLAVCLHDLEDRRQVPVGGDVVGDDAEPELRRRGGGGVSRPVTAARGERSSHRRRPGGNDGGSAWWFPGLTSW